MAADTPHAYVPTTISSEAKESSRLMPAPHLTPTSPGPSEFEKWTAMQEAATATTIERRAQPLIDLLEPELTDLGFPAAEVGLMDRWLGVQFDKQVDEMRRALRQKLFECSAPSELLERFQLSDA